MEDLLEYKDGKLFWKKARRGCTVAGQEAGYLKKDTGYRELTVRGKRTYAHRVIYEMLVGEIPEGYEIDHINGDRSDNRIENLRCVTKRDNVRASSKRPRKNNRTGVPGVYYNSSPRMRGYVARIGVNGKKVELGYRKDFFEAVCLRKAAEIRYGYASL